MPIRPDSHRASGLARRAVVLNAAVEIIAEHGVGAATHRAVAARAGVPPSTTSYFFASIDELVIEALRGVVDTLTTRLDAITATLADNHAGPGKTIETVVAALTAAPVTDVIAQFEAYLDAARRPALRAEVQRAVAVCENIAATALRLLGAEKPDDGARAVVAMIDGFALHRLAWPRKATDTTALSAALHALLAAYAPRSPTGTEQVPSSGDHH